MEIGIDRNEITRQVLAFHEMAPGLEKEKEEKRLVRMTEELIYIEPVRSGYISEKDACGFYLEERRNAARILDAYRISKLTYPDYIGQILRVRVRNYLLHKQEEESDIKRLHYAERIHQDNVAVMDMEEIYETEGRKQKPYPDEGIRTARNLKEAFGKIIRDTSGIRYPDQEMRRKSTRYGLLCMLLALPKGEGYDYIEHFARLLHIKEENVITILRLRDEDDDERNEKLSKHREVIGKHFKILLRLNTAYKLSDDEREKEKISEVSLRLEELIEKRCRRLRHENAGFTQREMAVLLGTSRSTVCSDMKKARSYLNSLKA